MITGIGYEITVEIIVFFPGIVKKHENQGGSAPTGTDPENFKK